MLTYLCGSNSGIMFHVKLNVELWMNFVGKIVVPRETFLIMPELR